MTNFTKKINNILDMLQSLENDINLAGYSLTEKKVFYTISQISERDGGCNITDVINESFLSRSTVYKAIKKLEHNSMLHVTQSDIDKREFYLNLSM
ncbi:MarR family transcriptional regulator [Gammaproteobacteria bacterium]|nr:MarR family transcriptional regulator [Gammaproteobacteria bacterium]